MQVAWIGHSKDKGGDFTLIKKDWIIAISLTFCLTATLLMMVSTESSSSVSEYDPWIDLNEDGTIDILDITNVAIAFRTSGDPTRTVNVVNSHYQWTDRRIIEPQDHWLITHETAGYKQVFIGLWSQDVTADVSVEFEVRTSEEYYVPTFRDQFELTQWSWIEKAYEVKGTLFALVIENPSQTATEVYVGIYVTT